MLDKLKILIVVIMKHALKRTLGTLESKVTLKWYIYLGEGLASVYMRF